MRDYSCFRETQRLHVDCPWLAIVEPAGTAVAAFVSVARGHRVLDVWRAALVEHLPPPPVEQLQPPAAAVVAALSQEKHFLWRPLLDCTS